MEIAALTDWLVVCITIGRKEIGRKKCKAERARGPGTESWERNRQRGLGKVTAAWGNHCFIFCASNGLAGETSWNLCRKGKRERLQLQGLKSNRQIGWECLNQHLVASFVSLGRFHNSRAVSEPPWTMPEATW